MNAILSFQRSGGNSQSIPRSLPFSSLARSRLHPSLARLLHKRNTQLLKPRASLFKVIDDNANMTKPAGVRVAGMVALEVGVGFGSPVVGQLEGSGVAERVGAAFGVGGADGAVGLRDPKASASEASVASQRSKPAKRAKS